MARTRSPKPRCRLCGVTDYAPSMGGPDICPACDAGVFHDAALAGKRMLGLKPPPTVNERCPHCHGRGYYDDLGDPYMVSEVYCPCEAGRALLGASKDFPMDVEDYEPENPTAWDRLDDRSFEDP